jgi:hypothetical protein
VTYCCDQFVQLPKFKWKVRDTRDQRGRDYIRLSARLLVISPIPTSSTIGLFVGRWQQAHPRLWHLQHHSGRSSDDVRHPVARRLSTRAVRDKLFLPNYEGIGRRPHRSCCGISVTGSATQSRSRATPGGQTDYALASEEAGLVGTMSSAEFKSPLNSTCPLDWRLAQTLWYVGL